LADGLARAATDATGLADAARKRYEEHFAPERLTQRLIEIYGEVLR
jgi:glycosyltransferase involved in cell wall biosynthesis